MSQPPQNLLAAADAALARADWASAITAYRAALTQNPGHADAWFNLGYALRAAREFEAALDAYQQAIDCGLAGAEEAMVNRSAILSEHLGRAEPAEAELRAALSIKADFAPALLNLGMLREDRGDADGASEAYQRLLASNPGNGRAMLRLTMIAIHDGSADRWIPKLEAALRTSGLPTDDRADIGFALANALDAMGRHDDAWAALMAANSADRQTLPPALRYDAGAHDRLVDALMALPALAVPNGASLGAEPSAPIFICGLFRSGSTLTEQILSRHPQITAAGELEIVPALIGREVQPYPARLAHSGPAEFAAWRAAYLEQARQIIGDAPLFTDKRCDNFLHIGFIKALFPKAKIVHTVRDSDDVLLSTLFLRFGHAVSYGGSVADFRHWHGNYVRLMRHWRSLFGADIIDLDYDRLVAGPEREVRQLLAGLSLEWDDACLDHGSSDTARVLTASNWQVRQPLHRRSSGRARAYADYLGGSLSPGR